MQPRVDPHRPRADEDETGLRAAVRRPVDRDRHALVAHRRERRDVALRRAAHEEPAVVGTDRARPQLLRLLEVPVAVRVVVDAALQGDVTADGVADEVRRPAGRVVGVAHLVPRHLHGPALGGLGPTPGVDERSSGHITLRVVGWGRCPARPSCRRRQSPCPPSGLVVEGPPFASCRPQRVQGLPHRAGGGRRRWPTGVRRAARRRRVHPATGRRRGRRLPRRLRRVGLRATAGDDAWADRRSRVRLLRDRRHRPPWSSSRRRAASRLLPGGDPGTDDAARRRVSATRSVAALDSEPSRIIVCLGGSASTDGGTGLLVALGARLLDADGAPVAPGGAWLDRIAALDLSLLDPRLRDTRHHRRGRRDQSAVRTGRSRGGVRPAEGGHAGRGRRARRRPAGLGRRAGPRDGRDVAAHPRRGCGGRRGGGPARGLRRADRTWRRAHRRPRRARRRHRGRRSRPHR